MTDLFKEKARDWDVNEMVRELSSAVGSAMMEHVPFDKEMRVMDFGAGTGLISSKVAPLVKKIVAVDTSEAMLSKLAAKPEMEGRVEILCRDITERPIDDSFDLIMSAMAMHHVRDTARLIESFARHLKPGGLIALADLDSEDGTFHPEDMEGIFHNGFDRDELRDLLGRHGFGSIHFYTAHTVKKDGKLFPVFLVTARKAYSS